MGVPALARGAHGGLRPPWATAGLSHSLVGTGVLPLHKGPEAQWLTLVAQAPPPMAGITGLAAGVWGVVLAAGRPGRAGVHRHRGGAPDSPTCRVARKVVGGRRAAGEVLVARILGVGSRQPTQMGRGPGPSSEAARETFGGAWRRIRRGFDGCLPMPRPRVAEVYSQLHALADAVAKEVAAGGRVPGEPCEASRRLRTAEAHSGPAPAAVKRRRYPHTG